MFGITMKRVRMDEDLRNSTGAVVPTLTRVLQPMWTAATRFVRRVTAPVTVAVASFALKETTMTTLIAPISDAAQPDSIWRDRLRQTLNVILSVAQFAAATLIFQSQFGDDLFYNAGRPEPVILPADYTFSIWGFIFPTSIAYAIYQALPSQRTNDLHRRIGFPTAFAFGCITLWSVATLFNPILYTVPLFFGALAALVYAVYQSSNHARPLTTAERLLVIVPLGVYAAWCTVGTIANTSTSLFALGYTDLVLGEQVWAVIMLVVGGLIASFMTTVSRGNIPYALGVMWALIGIVVATVTERPSPTVATTAGAMAVVVGLALVRARWAATAQA